MPRRFTDTAQQAGYTAAEFGEPRNVPFFMNAADNAKFLLGYDAFRDTPFHTRYAKPVKPEKHGGVHPDW